MFASERYNRVYSLSIYPKQVWLLAFMAILDENTLDFTSRSLEQTVRLGVRLGELLQPRDFICMSGDLGAGKTSFARGIGRGWGSTIRVTSPSFTLVNEYPRQHDGRVLYHIDCYRLEASAEIATVGLEDIFESDGAIMVEWPERIDDWLPTDRIWIALSYVDDMRRHLRITAQGDRSIARLSEFKHSAFGV